MGIIFRRLAYYMVPLNLGFGTSLVVQWLLNFCTSTAGRQGKVWPLVGKLRSCMLLGQKKKTRLHRRHVMSQSSPLNHCGHGSAHPPTLPDNRRLRQGSPPSSQCGTGGLHRGWQTEGVPLRSVASLPHGPTGTRERSGPTRGSGRWPRTKARLGYLPEKKPAAPIPADASRWGVPGSAKCEPLNQGTGVSGAPSGPVVDPLPTQTLVNAWFNDLVIKLNPSKKDWNTVRSMSTMFKLLENQS